MVAVVAVIGVTQGVPQACAVGPPPVDGGALPAPATPAPPHPSVQQQVCAVAAWDPAVEATQTDGLDLPAVWALTRGEGQRVAVIDTGVARHRRLPNLVAGGDYVSTGDGTADCDGHGTLVAGIIGAATDPAGDRFGGLAPRVTIIGIRQSSATFAVAGRAAGVGDVYTLAQAVRTAADLGASVINISTVACRPATAGLDDKALGAALAYAVEVKGAVVVTAAGNTDDGCGGAEPMIVSPAWYDAYVMTVGSVNADGAPSAFSARSPWVDVAAPGEAVLSLSTVGDAMANSVGGKPIRGTSFAAPVVSGLAALIRSRFPQWTPRQVMERIISTAHHPPGGRDDAIGAGVIDPLAAVSVAARQAGPDGAASALAPDGGASDPVTPPAWSATPAAQAAPPAPRAAPDGLRTALTGTAALLTLLLAALTGRALSARRRAPTEPAGD